MPIHHITPASTHLRNAQTALHNIRDVSKQKGKKFWGQNFISDEAKQAVHNFVVEDHVAQRQIKLYRNFKSGKDTPSTVILNLLERFEEYCRRVAVDIPEKDKIFAYRLLVSQLYLAANALYAELPVT